MTIPSLDSLTLDSPFIPSCPSSAHCPLPVASRAHSSEVSPKHGPLVQHPPVVQLVQVTISNCSATNHVYILPRYITQVSNQIAISILGISRHARVSTTPSTPRASLVPVQNISRMHMSTPTPCNIYPAVFQ